MLPKNMDKSRKYLQKSVWGKLDKRGKESEFRKARTNSLVNHATAACENLAQRSVGLTRIIDTLIHLYMLVYLHYVE